MEAVILEALGDVNGFDTGGFLEAADIEDKFVSATGIGIGIEDWIMRSETRHNVISIQEGNLRGMC